MAAATPPTQAVSIEAGSPTRGPWRSSDLELLPDNGARYEIINGELFISKSPIGIIRLPAPGLLQSSRSGLKAVAVVKRSSILVSFLLTPTT